jgi:hypothetical protein
MAIDPADLIRRFEPVLYFHQGERFFPSDAKRYMEHSALWNVQSTVRDNKSFWGGTSSRTLPHFPEIARNQIAAVAEELGDPSESRVYLGSINLDETAELEHFLEPAGWSGSGSQVNASTDNLYANFNTLWANYEFDDEISAGRFWYHAELFTSDRLQAVLRGRPKIVSDFFGNLNNPLLLCYNLLFPAHEEPLEGCGDCEFQRSWASFAGEWACVAVLLQGDGNQINYKPTHVGLTSRNAGAVQFLGQETRIGMRIFPIDLLKKITRTRGNDPQGQPRPDGEHVLLFVSKGTHGLYDSGEAQAVPAFSPADTMGDTCGAYETVTAENDDEAAHDASLDRRHTVVIYKTVIGALDSLATSIVGSGFNPLAAAWGALGGVSLGLIEGALAYGGMEKFAGIQDPLQSAPSQFDHPPAVSEIRVVIGPPGVSIPDAPAEFLQTWPRFGTDENVLSTKIGDRQYSLFVGTAADLSSRPVWLPSGPISYQGRWGNRVQHDPFNRRVGMNFPDFAGMFFDGLGM